MNDLEWVTTDSYFYDLFVDGEYVGFVGRADTSIEEWFIVFEYPNISTQSVLLGTYESLGKAQQLFEDVFDES